MLWGLDGILYAQPISDIIAAIITAFMAMRLYKELPNAKLNSGLMKDGSESLLGTDAIKG
jgi:hypothetical protein